MKYTLGATHHGLIGIVLSFIECILFSLSGAKKESRDEIFHRTIFLFSREFLGSVSLKGESWAKCLLCEPVQAPELPIETWVFVELIHAQINALKWSTSTCI